MPARGRQMTYEEMAELALTCARNAHGTTSRDVARMLWKLAVEYRNKAAKLDGGGGPDIGEPPKWMTD